MTNGTQPSISGASEQELKEKYGLERQKMTLESGALGRFFGSAQNAPTNIAGIILIFLVVPTILLPFVKADVPALDYLKIMAPVITLILGYLFGRKT